MGTRARASWAGRSGVWLVGIGLGLAGACGGESKDPPLNPTGAGAVGGGMFPTGSGGKAGASSGGTAGRGGTSGMTGEGGDAGEMVSMPGGPIVEVTSPEAVDDPDGGNVLVESEVTVICEARPGPGGEQVDPSTVAIQLLDAEDETVDEVIAAPTGNPYEYSANVILTKVEENGIVGFRCRAADTSTPPLVGTDTIHSLLDNGPLITVVSPVPDQAYPLMQALRVRFNVDPDPVGSSDAGAAVDTVTLQINGVSIDSGTPSGGEYDLSVDLADPTMFPNVLSGPIPVTIRATNRRDPSAERVVTYGFVIDGEGPTITIVNPDEGDVVGGRVPVRFTVVDALSGVDSGSVVVQVNQERFSFDADTWPRVGDEFTYMMDSTQAEEDSKVQANITITANDEVGNTATEKTLNLYLDNVPPTVDLDPEFVRDSRRDGDALICSAAFDPVGPRAANDYPKPQRTGDVTVTRTPTFRAIVWEETNFVEGVPILTFSGTDDSSVRVYMQPDVSTPLLVDNSMDGVCDDVDATAFVQNLTPLDKEGTAWFKAGDATESPVIGDTCTLDDEMTEPAHLCPNKESDMTRVISHAMDGEPPVIYAIAPQAGPACTGTYWEIATAAAEGWVCLAAVAKDHAGNLGVSTPLRLCYDDPATEATPACADGLGTPPTCTDGCTPPPHFQGAILRPR
jgi:hypothetical protein